MCFWWQYSRLCSFTSLSGSPNIQKHATKVLYAASARHTGLRSKLRHTTVLCVRARVHVYSLAVISKTIIVEIVISVSIMLFHHYYSFFSFSSFLSLFTIFIFNAHLFVPYHFLFFRWCRMCVCVFFLYYFFFNINFYFFLSFISTCCLEKF